MINRNKLHLFVEQIILNRKQLLYACFPLLQSLHFPFERIPNTQQVTEQIDFTAAFHFKLTLSLLLPAHSKMDSSY